MIDKFVKITPGFVSQTFVKNDEAKHVCVRQEFTAGEPSDYEDDQGRPLKKMPDHEHHFFDMVQPQPKVKYLLYNELLGYLEDEEAFEAASREEALEQIVRNMGYSLIEALKQE